MITDQAERRLHTLSQSQRGPETNPDFKIAVDQQTKARDRTFKGVPNSGCPLVPVGQPHPYLPIFNSILSNHLNMPKTMLWGCFTSCSY